MLESPTGERNISLDSSVLEQLPTCDSPPSDSQNRTLDCCKVLRAGPRTNATKVRTGVSRPAYLDGSKSGTTASWPAAWEMASRPGSIDASKAFRTQKAPEGQPQLLLVVRHLCRCHGFSSEPQIRGGNVPKVRRVGPVRGSAPMRVLHGVAAGHGPHAASVPQFFREHTHHLARAPRQHRRPSACPAECRALIAPRRIRGS